MRASDRAAEIIRQRVQTWAPLIGPRQSNADVVAKALADAGLLVTAEIQAVLDHLASVDGINVLLGPAFKRKFDAYLASRPS